MLLWSLKINYVIWNTKKQIYSRRRSSVIYPIVRIPFRREKEAL